MAGDGIKYQIGQVAYVKLVLHAHKHKYSSVNGVLVGKVTQQDAPTDANDGAREGHSVVEIVDAVPLFHGQLGLLPMLELALTQVRLPETFQNTFSELWWRLVQVLV